MERETARSVMNRCYREWCSSHC